MKPVQTRGIEQYIAKAKTPEQAMQRVDQTFGVISENAQFLHSDGSVSLSKSNAIDVVLDRAGFANQSGGGG